MKKEAVKERKITLDDLARMVQKGFEGVDRRFGDVDRRFDELKEGIDQRFLALDNTINYRFDQIEKVMLPEAFKRIDKLEEQVKELREKVGLRK